MHVHGRRCEPDILTPMADCNFKNVDLTCPTCGFRSPTDENHRKNCRPLNPPTSDQLVRLREAVDTTAHGLGDMTAAGLAAIGVTKERVSAWLGRSCKCADRQEWLNELGRTIVSWISSRR